MDPTRPPTAPPAGHTDDGIGARADAYATAPLLNCLLREVAQPVPGPGGPRVYRLPSGERLLRVRGDGGPPRPR